MSLPALKIEHGPSVLRPRLRLVRTRQAPRARSAAASAAAYEGFVIFCVLAAVLAAAAIGRVWLSAEAAQATLQSARLTELIKAARFQGDMLEVQESRLAAPARVQFLATRSLGMAPAARTLYIDLRPRGSSPRAAPIASASQPDTSPIPAVIDAVVGVAAGEARVLLVGDVALASSR